MKFNIENALNILAFWSKNFVVLALLNWSWQGELKQKCWSGNFSRPARTSRGQSYKANFGINYIINVTVGSASSREFGCFPLSYFPCSYLNFYLIKVKRWVWICGVILFPGLQMFSLSKYFIFRLAVKMSKLDLKTYVKPYKKSNRVVTLMDSTSWILPWITSILM